MMGEDVDDVDSAVAAMAVVLGVIDGKRSVASNADRVTRGAIVSCVYLDISI